MRPLRSQINPHLWFQEEIKERCVKSARDSGPHESTYYNYLISLGFQLPIVFGATTQCNYFGLRGVTSRLNVNSRYRQVKDHLLNLLVVKRK